MKSLKFGFLLVLVATFGCTFNPDSEYFKNVQQPATTPTTVSFFSTSDTTDFRGTVNLDIHTVNQSEIVHYKLSLGDAIISEQDGAPYITEIDSRKYPDGTYDLTLVLVKRVNSESLASKVEKEFSTVELKKKVIVFNASLPKPVLTASIENGILVLHWQPYEGRVFKSYIINGSSFNNSPVFITNPRQASLAIPDFVGGYAYFSIQLTAYREGVTTNQEFDYLIGFSIVKASNGVSVTWGESPFVNYNGIKITTYSGPDVANVIVLDKMQHSYLYPLTWKFPYDITVMVDAISNRNIENLAAYSTFTTVLRLTRFDDGINIFRSQNDTIYTMLSKFPGYTYDLKGITTVNSKNGNQINRRNGSIGMSPDGLTIFELKNNTLLVRINPGTLDDAESFNVSSVIGAFNNLISIAVSDLRVILMYVERNDANYYYVFDWKTKQLLYTGKISDSSHNRFRANGRLFPDGRKFYQTDMIMLLDKTPASIRNINSTFFEIGIPQKGHIVSWVSNNLYEADLDSKDPTISVSYPKAVVKIFSSDGNFIAVVYDENGFLKIDFIELGTLNIVNTLATSLKANAISSKNFYMIDRSFYMYDQNQYTFNKFDF